MAKFKRTMDCGCIVAVDYNGVVQIDYCPKHKAAPKMYEALEAITDQFCKVDKLYTRDIEIISQAKKALSEAEGK